MELFKALFLGITGILLWDFAHCHPLVSSPLFPRGSLSRRYAKNGRPILAMANSPRCTYNGKPVEDGRQVASPEPCLNCTCSSGVLLCFLQTCPSVIVPSPECYATRVGGECCPQIVCTVPTVETSAFTSYGEAQNHPTPYESQMIKSVLLLKPSSTGSNEEANQYKSPSAIPMIFQPSEIPTEEFPIPLVQSNHRPVDGIFRTKVRDRVRSTVVQSMTERVTTEKTPFSKKRTEKPSTEDHSVATEEDLSEVGSAHFATDPTLANREVHSSSTTGSCNFSGRNYSEGMAMLSFTQCDYCYCIRGKQMCIRPKCHLNIDGCIAQYHNGFTCCPSHYQCETLISESVIEKTNHQPPIPNSQISSQEIVSTGCKVDGIDFALGVAVPSRGHCQTCYCTQLGVVCRRLECAPKVDGCEPIVPEGHCCPKEYSCGGLEFNSSQGLVSHSTDDYEVKVIYPEPLTSSVESGNQNDTLSSTVSDDRKSQQNGVTGAQKFTIHLTEDSSLEKVSILPRDNLAILVVSGEEGDGEKEIKVSVVNPTKLTSSRYKPNEVSTPAVKIPNYITRMSISSTKGSTTTEKIPSSIVTKPFFSVKSPITLKPPFSAIEVQPSVSLKTKGNAMRNSSTSFVSDYSYSVTPGREFTKSSSGSGIKVVSPQILVNPTTEYRKENSDKISGSAVHDPDFYEYDDYDYNRDSYSYDYQDSGKQNSENSQGSNFRQTFSPFSDYPSTAFGDRINSQDKKQNIFHLRRRTTQGVTSVSTDSSRSSSQPIFDPHVSKKVLVEPGRTPPVAGAVVHEDRDSLKTDIRTPVENESKTTTEVNTLGTVFEKINKLNRPHHVTRNVSLMEESNIASSPSLSIKGNDAIHLPSNSDPADFSSQSVTVTAKGQISGAVKTAQIHSSIARRTTLKDAGKPTETTASYFINRKGVNSNIKSPGSVKENFQTVSTEARYPPLRPHVVHTTHDYHMHETSSVPGVKAPNDGASNTQSGKPINNALPKDIAELLWSLVDHTSSPESVDLVAEVLFTEPSISESLGNSSSTLSENGGILEATIQPAPKLILEKTSAPKDYPSAKIASITTEHSTKFTSHDSPTVVFSNHGPTASRRPLPAIHDLHLLTTINNHKGSSSHHTIFTTMRPKPSQASVVEFSNHKPFSFRPPSPLQNYVIASHRKESDTASVQSRESPHKLHRDFSEENVLFTNKSANDSSNLEMNPTVHVVNEDVRQASSIKSIVLTKPVTSQVTRINVPSNQGFRFGDRFNNKSLNPLKGSSSLSEKRITPSMRWNDASTNPVTVGFSVQATTDWESVMKTTETTTDSTLLNVEASTVNVRTTENKEITKDAFTGYKETMIKTTEVQSTPAPNIGGLGTRGEFQFTSETYTSDATTHGSSSFPTHGDTTNSETDSNDAVTNFTIKEKQSPSLPIEIFETTNPTIKYVKNDPEINDRTTDLPFRSPHVQYTTTDSSKVLNTSNFTYYDSTQSSENMISTTTSALDISNYEEHSDIDESSLNETKLFRAEENYKESSSLIDRRLISFGGSFDSNKSETSPVPVRLNKKPPPLVSQPQPENSPEVTDVCFVDGRYYNSGEVIVKSNPCEMCRCFYGHPLCQVQQCPSPPGPSCILEFLSGYCCPRVTCGVNLDAQSVPTMDNQWKPLESPFPAGSPQRKNGLETESPESAESGDNVAVPVIKPESLYENVTNISLTPSEPIKDTWSSSYEIANVSSTFHHMTKPELHTMAPKRELNPVWDPNSVEKQVDREKDEDKVVSIHDNSSGVRKILNETVFLPLSKMSLSPLAATSVSESVVSSIPVRTTMLINLEESQSSSPSQYEYYAVENVTSEIGGKLKISGCNVYGKYYNINDKVSVLSKICNECICSVEGITCSAIC